MDIIELQNKLDELSAWRKRELLQAHFLAESAPTQETQRYLCRSWVMMMYAHCDNFLKESAKTYLEYIKNASNPHYKSNLMWLIMRGKDVLIDGNDRNYKSLNDYNKTDSGVFFKIILGKDIFDKKSFQYKILRFFCDWVLQINYDYNEFRDFCDRLNVRRHAIAHGEQEYVDVAKDCVPWHEKTIKFIDSLKESLLESAKRGLN
jgi:hypothetical protein